MKVNLYMGSSHANSEPMSDTHGNVCEVYSGIQGEGLLVGERQIFVRLAGCNLSCSYCDTPHARIASNLCCVEQTAGLRNLVTVSNPIAAKDVATFVMQLGTSRALHHSVVLTGGEPLVQAEFASSIARALKHSGVRVFLETNGSLPDSLPKILPFLDYISMDIKLTSATAGPRILDVHMAFLRQAISVDTYVKMVVTRSTSTDEIAEAAKMVEAIDPAIPVVLQPVTDPYRDLSPSAGQMLKWQELCKLYLQNVRVIPQCHKAMGQL